MGKEVGGWPVASLAGAGPQQMASKPRGVDPTAARAADLAAGFAHQHLNHELRPVRRLERVAELDVAADELRPVGAGNELGRLADQHADSVGAVRVLAWHDGASGRSTSSR